MLDPFDVIPFRFLRPEERALVLPHLRRVRVEAGTRVLTQGDATDDDMWLLLDGHVEIVDRRGEVPRVLGGIGPGHYFGERRALFDMPRAADVVARTDCAAAVLPGEALRELVATVPTFATALSRLLRDDHGVFAGFERFLAELEHGAAEGYLVLRKLIHRYKPLAPALHRGANDPAIDWDALSYAVRRLPEGIHRAVALFLTDDLPASVPDPERFYPAVPTAARRRSVFEMMPGKLLVLLRDGRSDVIDVICCLCVYAVEARKLRRRVQRTEVLVGLRAEPPVFPFTDDERARLEALWPGRVAQVLIDVAAHHEDFSIHVRKELEDYNAAKGEAWTRQIHAAATDLLGCAPEDLPHDVPVHILSSNTHSVDNCLSPWLAANRAAIEAWGEQACPELWGMDWRVPGDRLVALAREYLEAHPEARRARREADEHAGVRFLDRTAYTGIGVQLYDLSRLGGNGGRPGLLVNIEYAFGQQAEPIVARLIALFGHNIRSIQVLGKAGGLVGARGDVLVATRFVEQRSDALVALPLSDDVDRLRARLPDRAVHVGPVLTVLGTILQNQVMLQSYRHLHRCVGLEMEGTWYARQIFQAKELGMLPRCVRLAFWYYVSDLPLKAEHTLAGAMGAHEGIPPLYAITREFLARVLGREPDV